MIWLPETEATRPESGGSVSESMVQPEQDQDHGRGDADRRVVRQQAEQERIGR